MPRRLGLRAAGALRVKARFLLGTREGRDAYEVAKAFGPHMQYSIGYRVPLTGAKTRGGIRCIAHAPPHTP